jgi:hypothetical protein
MLTRPARLRWAIACFEEPGGPGFCPAPRLDRYSIQPHNDGNSVLNKLADESHEVIIPQGFASDDRLRARLQAVAKTNPDFWSFRGNSARRHAHGLFHYPAMMVPQMQSELIADLKACCRNLRSVYDPFVGAGTVMTEAMLQGLDFRGHDVNPLAVLICRVKAGPFYTDGLVRRAKCLCGRIRADRGRAVEVTFPGVAKWFRPDVARQLSRIVRAIRREPELWSRRFFWVALAETVRLSSNSRTSTVKLHIRPKAEIASRPSDAVDLFERIVETNVEQMRQKHQLLVKADAVSRGIYRGQVDIVLGDSGSEDAKPAGQRFDALITSPPYGDNVTTVTYGQHAYLPLQWIDREDIDPDFPDGLLATTHAIDSCSLGGSRLGALESVPELRRRSPAFGRIMRAFADQPRDRRLRTAGWCLSVGLRRIARLREPYASAMLTKYGHWTTRPTYPHDLTRLD